MFSTTGKRGRSVGRRGISHLRRNAVAYVLSGEVECQPNDNGHRTLDLVQLNAGFKALGSSLVEPRHSTIQQVTAIVRLPEGATIALRAGQASGVPLEVVRGTLSAAFVGA